MPNLLAPPPDVRHDVLSDGEAHFWQPERGIAVCKATGVFSLALMERVIDFIDPIIDTQPAVRIFADLSQLSYYTREARERGTRFFSERRASVDDIHILFTSKTVALGVSAFKHALGLGQVHGYTDRHSFLRSLTEAVCAASVGTGPH